MNIWIIVEVGPKSFDNFVILLQNANNIIFQGWITLGFGTDPDQMKDPELFFLLSVTLQIRVFWHFILFFRKKKTTIITSENQTEKVFQSFQ